MPTSPASNFSPAERFITGLRNGEGFGFDSSGRVFATQHGRDQLSQNFAKLYTPKQSAELPAEEVVLLQKGADYGWPECYYDRDQQKLVLAPEYGGDGGKKVGVCAEKTAPVASFPGHWAPNDLLIYTGTALPAAYHDGAFIAFHGSWNRAPEPQGGYNVVFQPLKDGKAAGDYIVFADGFAGAIKEPGQAAFRPTGLAMAPDGALFISDDKHGRIWRVTYQGASDAPLAPAPAPKVAAASSGEPSSASPPEGIHPDAGRPGTASLPVPPGATREQVALGDRIFHGEAAGGTCTGCHGSDARGGPQAPSLVKGRWLIGDGSLKSITETISERRAEAAQLRGADAAEGRRAAVGFRCRSRRRLCLGDRPSDPRRSGSDASSPAKAGRGTTRRVVEGASTRRSTVVAEASFSATDLPTIMLQQGARPLPRYRGAGCVLVNHDRRRAHAFALDDAVEGRRIAGSSRTQPCEAGPPSCEISYVP